MPDCWDSWVETWMNPLAPIRLRALRYKKGEGCGTRLLLTRLGRALEIGLADWDIPRF